MQCPMQSRENADLLLSYSERKLAPELASMFQQHVEACAACRGALAAQQAVWSALDDWEVAEITPDFNRRLYQRIESEGRKAWWRSVLAPAAWPLRPAPMAAACLALVAVLLFRAPSASDFARNTESGIESIDIEQVEQSLDDLDMLKQLGVAAPAPADAGERQAL